MKTAVKVAGAIILIPIALVALLIVLLYLPPVQNWAVRRVAAYISGKTGMDVTVGHVNLDFALDLGVENLRVLGRNDSLPLQCDTIADIRHIKVDVELLPLFRKKVDIDAFEINGARINTGGLISDMGVKGTIGRLSMKSHCVDLKKENARIDGIETRDAELMICLSDTAAEDTAKNDVRWVISCDTLSVRRSRVRLLTPGDTMEIAAGMERLTVADALIDLGLSRYEVRRLEWRDGWLRYDNNMEPRREGLDAAHIELESINIGVDSIVYDPSIKMHITECAMKEKSGLELTRLDGHITMDSASLNIPDLVLRTTDSNINLQVDMDMNTFDENDPGQMNGSIMAQIGKQDLMRVMKGTIKNDQYAALPNQPIFVRGTFKGNMNHLSLIGFDVNQPTSFHIKTDGEMNNLADADRMSGEIKLSVKTYDLDFVTSMTGMSGDLSIPHNISAFGTVTISGQRYDADIKAGEGKGVIKARGFVDMKNESYKASLDISELRIDHFLPRRSIYSFTGSAEAEGQGFNPLKHSARLNVAVSVAHLGYGKWDVDNVNAKAALKNGVLHADIASRNALVDGQIDLNASIGGQRHGQNIQAELSTEINSIDLYALGMTDKPLSIAVKSRLDAAGDMNDYYRAAGSVTGLSVSDRLNSYHHEDITFDMLTRSDTSWVHLTTGDLQLDINAEGGYKTLLSQLTAVADESRRQFAAKEIDRSLLRERLPAFHIHLASGNNNPLAIILNMQKDIAYDDIGLDLTSSVSDGLNGKGHLYGLDIDSTVIDTIRFNISDGSLSAQVRNSKSNAMVTFGALLEATLTEHGADATLHLYDSDDRLGLLIGAQAQMMTDGINLHLTPEKPIVGYREFTLNDDNFIFLDQNKRIKAKVNLLADDGTGVMLYSTDGADDALQDLTLSLKEFDIAKTLSVLPYAPAVTGMLNGDYHMVLSKDSTLSIMSDMSVTDLTYEHSPMGNISTEFVYMPKSDGSHYVDAVIMSDSVDVGTVSGTYNNSAKNIDASLTLSRFPLNIANGFIPDHIIGFKGKAEGELTVKGNIEKPRIDGEVYLDSAYIFSDPYGVEMLFDNDPVSITGSELSFENFGLTSHNGSHLDINGNVNFSDPGRTFMNMNLRARDFLLIDAKENTRSEAFGKAYVNFMGSIKGYISSLTMRGRLDVLGSTDMTYILRDSPLTTDNTLDELVKFTDFTDTAEVVVIRPELQGFTMDMTVGIDEQAHILCALNADKSNYVDLEGGGDLRLKYNNVDNMQLTGRYTLNNGEMKYSLPVIPLKTFTIQDGSYVLFSGDPYNPGLNITATERVKASVSSSNGASRSVAFDCGVVISKTLNDMGLEFIIDAPEDITVQNELSMMGEAQRGKIAVTMLTTGMYLADGNTSAFSMNSALSSFLQSEINNITGNALRTIDLSVGLEGTTDATGSMHTDYSFKFAKRFWDNRLSISVGGKVSTGESTDSWQRDDSFLDNVTFEYRLSQSSNQYLKLFYDRDSYDFLEGDIGEYGVGFIWKRKMQYLKDIFSLKDKMQIPARADSLRAVGAEKETVK